jgi:hypothetical protein
LDAKVFLEDPLVSYTSECGTVCQMDIK